MIIILFEDIEEKGATRDNPSPPENSNAGRPMQWLERASAWIAGTIGINRGIASKNDPADERVEEKIG